MIKVEVREYYNTRYELYETEIQIKNERDMFISLVLKNRYMILKDRLTELNEGR